MTKTLERPFDAAQNYEPESPLRPFGVAMLGHRAIAEMFLDTQGEYRLNTAVPFVPEGVEIPKGHLFDLTSSGKGGGGSPSPTGMEVDDQIDPDVA